MKEKLKEIEKYAEENSVPIIEKNSIAFIMKYIQDNNVKNILEIGSAIGYSAILMASAKDDVYVTTIKDTGVIITDNLKFHGYVGKSDTIESKNLRQLVSKIESYIDFLKNNADFETTFYDIGDGLSVSKKRNHE